MRHQPALVHGVAEEAAADVIVEAAQHGIVDGAGDYAAGIAGCPNADRRATGSAGRWLAGISGCHCRETKVGRPGKCRSAGPCAARRHRSGWLRPGAHVAVEQIGHLVDDGLGVVGHLFRLVAIKRRHFGQNAHEGRLAQALVLGEVAADEEGLCLGIQEDVQRPAALVTHDVGCRLIHLVEIRPLHAVDDHGDEIVVDVVWLSPDRRSFPGSSHGTSGRRHSRSTAGWVCPPLRPPPSTSLLHSRH